jgi:phage baseplate assembly protein gpV
MSTIQGVAPGIVKEIDNKLGRVRVNLPWLDDSNKTYWARIATLMAGDGRGSWFMPEVGDEVLLGFEMGQVDNAYVLGFLWSEVDKPAISDDGIDEHVRRLRTVAKHRIDFDDRDNKQRIYMQSNSEHKLELNDFNKFVKISTKGNRFINLDDQNNCIDIQTAGQPEMKLDDQANKVTIKTGASDPSVVLDGMAQSVTITVGQNSVKVDPTGVTIQAMGTVSVNVTGSLSLQGTIVSITSQGPLSLQGSMVTLAASSVLSVTAPFSSFAGPVQTTSVISPLYTPGVGNLL